MNLLDWKQNAIETFASNKYIEYLKHQIAIPRAIDSQNITYAE